MSEKTCSKCGQAFPATTTYFYSDKRLKTGLSSYCKSCAITSATEWKQQHPERHREHSRLDRERHPEKRREYFRRYRQQFRERLLADRRAAYKRRKVQERDA